MGVFLTVLLYFGAAIICVQVAPIAYYSKHKSKRGISKAILFGVPVLIATFRGTTGSDSLMYIQAYRGIDAAVAARWNGFEPGFIGLVKILNNLGMPAMSLFFLMGSFTVLFFILFVENEKKYIDVKIATLIFMLDLLLFCMNGMRQGMVITLSLYAISVYLDGRKVQSVILVCIGTLIHISSLITLGVIVVDFIKNSKHYRIIVALMCVVTLFFVLNRTILGSIVSIVTNPAYAAYITADVESDGRFLNYIMKYGPFILLIVLGIPESKKYRKMRVFILLTIIGYITLLLSLFTGTQVQRLGYNFLYLNTAVIGYCVQYDLKVERIKFKHQEIRTMVILWCVILCIWNYFIKGYNEVVPYQLFV